MIAFCINRNIVECKGLCTGTSGNLRHCINRNIVECKGHRMWFCPCQLWVLIETLWNVKM